MALVTSWWSRCASSTTHSGSCNSRHASVYASRTAGSATARAREEGEHEAQKRALISTDTRMCQRMISTDTR
eukprot:2579286-Rhodomonas_salina.1